MKRVWKIVLLSVILIVILIGLIWNGYQTYFYMNQCEDIECFSKAMVDCKKRSYISDTTEMVIRYIIQGKENGKCVINVKLIRIKQGGSELSILEGEEMICNIALGVYTPPEKEIKNCHGLLKEKIQELIIKRMHTQIVENLGKISEETTNIL